MSNNNHPLHPAPGNTPAGNGSLKVRRTVRGITIRATGLPASLLAGAVTDTMGRVRGKSLTTVCFLDQGQDVLELDIDADNKVVDARPLHRESFVGSLVIGTPYPGKQLQFYSHITRKVVAFIHPVEAVSHGWRA